MRVFFKPYLYIFFSIVLILSGAAKAEYFVWHDAASGIDMSVPDNWSLAHNQKTDDLVTFQAPGERDYASCRLRKREDGRVQIYPAMFDKDIQKAYIDFEFWQAYVGEYNGTLLHRVKSQRSFGPTVAGSADFTFLSSAGPKVLMRGFAFAGYIDNFVYIFECSSAFHAYERWHPVFRSVLKSAHKTFYDRPHANGYYRSFLTDEPELIKGVDHLHDYE